MSSKTSDMKNILIIALLASSIASSAGNAAWLRYPAISPDGKSIAFSYKGDIYLVGSEGGEARQLTSHPAYDCSPVWAPDGRTIAFASDRHGNFDIHTVPFAGGKPRRITTHSASEQPWTFSPDGRRILFSAHIQDPASSRVFPREAMTELYSVSVEGGRPEQVLATPAEEVSFIGNSEDFIYQDKKGGENIWRKHHRSAVTRDLWMFRDGRHSRLTGFDGEDRCPKVSRDGKTVYYLSEREGSFNVYSFPTDTPEKVTRLTSHKTHPVRFLTVADDGRICYGYDGDIYVKDAGGKPRTVDVTIRSDNSGNGMSVVRVSGGSDSDVSPDGTQIAFISRGEVFVTSTSYKSVKQVTSTPAAEADVTFSPDGKTLAYASEREGLWNIYTAELFRKEDMNFSNATLITEKPLFRESGTERRAPQYSPDGKEIAYIEGRSRLMVLNLESGKTRQITDGSQCYSTSGTFHYRWSPDGKWFALSYKGQTNYSGRDIGIVSSKGGGSITNITRSGYSDYAPQWVLGGNALLFKSDMYGKMSQAQWKKLQDVMIIFLNRKAYDDFRMSEEEKQLEEERAKMSGGRKSAGKDIVIEFEGITERVERLTPASSDIGSFTLGKDGKTLFYQSGGSIWKLETKKGNPAKVGAAGGRMKWDRKHGTLYILGNRFARMDGKGKGIESIGVQTNLIVDHAGEREYMFDHIYREEKERFYDARMHGVDWDFHARHYRAFLPHISNNRDFAELMSECLGELNVSHTGCRLRPQKNPANTSTAHLGLLFDMNWKEDGLKVEEIVQNGPLDKADSRIENGDIIHSIDGVVILKDTDWYPLLDRKQGKRVLLGVRKPSGETCDIVTTPIDASEFNELLYRRWVRRNAETVERLSKGKLGYVHIKAMNDKSFQTIYSEVMGKYGDCEGIVIDTRFNGGGWLHEEIGTLFGGSQYWSKEVRGKFIGMSPQRSYNQASVMLIGEANYSNAHGVPWMYRHFGLGKLVGMPVPGTMTSVVWETLQDPALYFGIPVVGHKAEDGEYLENRQLEPDLKVENEKEIVVNGVDQQLEAAVKVLMQEKGTRRLRADE